MSIIYNSDRYKEIIEKNAIIKGLHALRRYSLIKDFNASKLPISIYTLEKGSNPSLRYDVVPNFNGIKYEEKNGILTTIPSQTINDLYFENYNAYEGDISEALSSLYFFYFDEKWDQTFINELKIPKNELDRLLDEASDEFFIESICW